MINIKKCVDNNILVFDPSALSGEFTKQLIFDIIWHYKDNYDAQITHISLPLYVFWNEDNFEFLKGIAFSGIHILYDQGEYLQEYIELGGYLSTDVSIVVGWDEINKNGIIGSF
jgi:hypothetical protein